MRKIILLAVSLLTISLLNAKGHHGGHHGGHHHGHHGHGHHHRHGHHHAHDRGHFNHADHHRMRNDLHRSYANRRAFNPNNHVLSPTNQRWIANRSVNNLNTYHPGYGNWFSNNFYANHQVAPFYNRPGVNWWAPATAAGAAAWLGWNGTNTVTPIYYDSQGNPVNTGNPTTPGNNTLFNAPSKMPKGTSSNVSPSAASLIAEQDPNSKDTSDQNDWMPLGIFAIEFDDSSDNDSKDSNSAEDSDEDDSDDEEDDSDDDDEDSQNQASNMFIQLALNKNGDIAGMYYDAEKDEVYQIAGFVDPKTQIAVFKLSDDPDSPTITTGIFNLTQDDTTAQVSFPDDTTETWVLVRIKNPNN